MRIDDISPERADILHWSPPLISDCLGLAYRACLGENERLVQNFTQHHRRLWMSLVSNNPSQATEARKPLEALARMCQLTEEALHAIDEIVMDELAEVVSRRFQGSPAKTRSYNRILIDAASVLTRARLAA